MKIKEQTRKLAAGYSKHCFEVVDRTDEVSSKHCFEVVSAGPRHGSLPCCHARRGVGFDLTVDEPLLQQMEEATLTHYLILAEATSKSERVGIRAYTSDFSPFFGQVPDLTGVYAASGLGSSGLTTGPIIGYHLAQLIQDKELTLDPENYPIENYVKRVKSE
ncbi:oxidoreductase%2C DadA family protein [Streptococcus pneumoniae]|nr:oxidoreductase%2C DadA family protein [Streptococcus pneumoniae]